jgi:hypothetical protein
MKNTKTLCKYAGGSQLYHLTTPESDYDERGLFMNTDPAYILGTRRFDESRSQNDDEDVVYKELNHFMTLLKQSNTEALEAMFCNETEFLESSVEMKSLRANRFRFLDSKRLFNCLRGYMKGELRLALGLRKGKLGGKRYEAVQKHGFSPKNWVQLFRLAQIGITFFNTDHFVVDCREFGEDFYSMLMSVKATPQKHTAKQLQSTYEYMEKLLVDSYENRKNTYTFDEDGVNALLLEIYKPYLT